MRRPILESGTATKTVFLTQAEQKLTPDAANKAIQRHIGQMIAELGKDKKLVTSISKTIVGWGDVKLQAKWVVLGEKQTKWARARSALQAAGGRLDGKQTKAVRRAKARAEKVPA